MNILVVGSGGRDTAIVWKLRQSVQVNALYCAPGNAGIARQAQLVSLKPTDTAGLLRFAKENSIDLTVVGPEQPLVDGIVDEFERNGLKIFGPSKMAAMLEGSKAFAKEFMDRHGIPTARFRSFAASELHLAETFVRELQLPVVVKADGLAAGKGVLICDSHDAAVVSLRDMMLKKSFGSAGERVVIEEYPVWGRSFRFRVDGWRPVRDAGGGTGSQANSGWRSGEKHGWHGCLCTCSDRDERCPLAS